MALKFDEMGLIPAIVQDFYTNDVLTLAYMNEESLALSIAERRTCFYSRSRRKLWRKGEESGNVQHIVSITADCDEDALVVRVIKDGPACHTGTESCFTHPVYVDDTVAANVADKGADFSYQGLYELLEGRKNAPQQGSYTSYLFEKGMDKILKKVGEEATEVIIAAKDDDRAEIVYEVADLCYHTMVMLVQAGIPLDEISAELARRHIIDHKVKQEKMQ